MLLLFYFYFIVFFFRGAKVWLPDKDYFDKIKSPVMYPDETTDWELPPINGSYFCFMF